MSSTTNSESVVKHRNVEREWVTTAVITSKHRSMGLSTRLKTPLLLCAPIRALERWPRE